MKIQNANPILFPNVETSRPIRPMWTTESTKKESSTIELRLKQVAEQNSAATKSNTLDVLQATKLSQTTVDQISTQGAGAIKAPSFADVLKLLQE